MTQKQEGALNKIISVLPDDFRESYREVAEYAVSLGYMPSLKGGGHYSDFTKSEHYQKRGIGTKLIESGAVYA